MGLPERLKLLPLDAQLEVEIPPEGGICCVGCGRRCKRLAEDTLRLRELVLLTGDVDELPGVFEGGEEWGIRTKVCAEWDERVRRRVDVGGDRLVTGGCERETVGKEDMDRRSATAPGGIGALGQDRGVADTVPFAEVVRPVGLRKEKAGVLLSDHVVECAE